MNSNPKKNHPLNNSERVRQFIKNIGLPLNKAPESLGLTPSQFMSWWSGQNNKLVQKRELRSLAEYFFLDESEVLLGTYDKNKTRSLLYPTSYELPDKYSKNQYSFLRSSAHIIEFLRITRGQYFCDRTLVRLGISPLLYSNHDHKISLNYFIDLLESLSGNGFSQNEIDHLASVLFLSIENTPLGQEFKRAKNYYECYEVLAKNIHLFDSNFTYEVDIDRKSFRMRACLHFDLHGQIQWEKTKVDQLLRYRQILLGWFPFLSKLPPLYPKCSTTRSHHGLCTEYSLTFDENESTRRLYCVPESPDRPRNP